MRLWFIGFYVSGRQTLGSGEDCCISISYSITEHPAHSSCFPRTLPPALYPFYKGPEKYSDDAGDLSRPPLCLFSLPCYFIAAANVLQHEKDLDLWRDCVMPRRDSLITELYLENALGFPLPHISRMPLFLEIREA